MIPIAWGVIILIFGMLLSYALGSRAERHWLLTVLEEHDIQCHQCQDILNLKDVLLEIYQLYHKM